MTPEQDNNFIDRLNEREPASEVSHYDEATDTEDVQLEFNEDDNE